MRCLGALVGWVAASIGQRANPAVKHHGGIESDVVLNRSAVVLTLLATWLLLFAFGSRLLLLLMFPYSEYPLTGRWPPKTHLRAQRGFSTFVNASSITLMLDGSSVPLRPVLHSFQRRQRLSVMLLVAV